MHNSATLVQALLAAFCEILCALSSLGGGGMMIGARTAAWAKRDAPLPYLRRVAYIESSSGESFIRTGVFSNEKRNRIICTVAFTEVGHVDAGAVFGAYGNLQICCRRDSTLATGGKNDGGIPYNLMSKVVCENYYNNNGVREIKVGDSISIGSGTAYNDYEFIALHQPLEKGVWYGHPTRARLYDAKIYLDSDLIFDAIPVLDLSGVPCLYDQVQSAVPSDDSSRFHYNQGTGELTWSELGA